MTNKLAFLFLFLGIISCKPSKVTTIVSEKIRIDTILNYKVITKYNAIHDTLTIENPCDSTGILTRFYSKITIPQGRIIIRSYKGSIKATIDIDSIKSIYEKQYQSRLKDSQHLTFERIVREVVPTWAILTIIIQGVLILVWVYFKFIY
jgi:hypothetical protein